MNAYDMFDALDTNRQHELVKDVTSGFVNATWQVVGTDLFIVDNENGKMSLSRFINDDQNVLDIRTVEISEEGVAELLNLIYYQKAALNLLERWGQADNDSQCESIMMMVIDSDLAILEAILNRAV